MYIYVQQQREHNFNIIRRCLSPRIKHTPNPPGRIKNDNGVRESPRFDRIKWTPVS